jgi:hypothetical protein
MIHYLMTFAFINIHLDIYRIIIIISYRKDRCFGYEEKTSEKEKILCFVVYEKKGKVFFAFGSKIKFRPQQSRLYTDKGEKIYYKVCTNLHKFSTIILQRSLQNFLQKSLLQQLLSFSSSFFSFIILYILKRNEKGEKFKEKGKVTSISFSLV